MQAISMNFCAIVYKSPSTFFENIGHYSGEKDCILFPAVSCTSWDTNTLLSILFSVVF